MRHEFIRYVKPLCAALALMAGSLFLSSAPGPTATVHQKSYYLSPNLVNFVRPGLVVQITAADVQADGTMHARVKLTDPKGQPLDRDGVTTPGPISVSLIAAYIPQGQKQYTAYTVRSATSPITGVTAIQAGTDSGGKWDKVADGEYQYTFKTRAPGGFDPTVTHTIGAYASRNLSEFDLGTQYDDTTFNFVPNGAPVTVVRDVVPSAACNQCHDQMAFHGGPRRSVELCVLCHQPQTIDPDTGNTVDLVVMTHKIHMGSSLPSVKAGKPYQIIGHNQSVSDYSDVVFPADVRNCTVCHQAGATQANAMFNPNRTACGACHDNVNFATGQNHLNMPQISDNLCANCHFKQGETEFDSSIIGAHTIPRFSTQLKGVVLDVLAVDGAAAGKSPTVTFSIKDGSGAPIPIKSMARVNLVLAGPNTDYSYYVSEDARGATGPGDGRYYWTFTKPIPAGASGSWSVGLEARRDATLNGGTVLAQTIREVGKNKVFYFSVDGTPVQARRTVVSLANCNHCHFSLSLHGNNRNQVEQCVLCHNPSNTASGTSIDFKVMVHRIHNGKNATKPYKIGNTSFADVGYPGELAQCGDCHVNGSEQLPLDQGQSAVTETTGYLNPMSPATAACTGCHDSKQAAAHASLAVSSQGESCGVCHGPNSDQSVNKVHAQ